MASGYGWVGDPPLGLLPACSSQPGYDDWRQRDSDCLAIIAADGSVSLPADAWDGVEALIGDLGAPAGGFLSDAVNALGWMMEAPAAGGIPTTGPDFASPT